MDERRKNGHVRVLPPETAKKIAAGEVVDRPAALVRELVDNAIDAGASTVEVAVEGGGATRTEVIDDGCGMEREDLELCWLPHATSKIATEDDLLSVATLGFRGEALSSVSAVARLEIVTCPQSGEAWSLSVGPGQAGAAAPRIGRDRRTRGTTVRVFGLFDAFPARKKFLKRNAAEAALCRQALVEKALAFPEVAFRFIQDGELKLFLPAVSSRRERFSAALLSDSEASFTHEIAASGPGFSLSIVVGGPELARGDRRVQYVIANGRRIQDFGLQQALEYGVQGWFPNGSHPVGAVYLDIDPALADFNIHPAKREARFKDPQTIHHTATAALREFMRRRGIAEAARTWQEETPETGFLPGSASWGGVVADGRARYEKPFAAVETASSPEVSRAAMEALMDDRPAFAPLPGRKPISIPEGPRPEGADHSGKIWFIGVAFDLFLVVQRSGALYLIDQHAAHERLLYDKLRAQPPAKQELLVPYPFSVDSDEEDAFLASRREELDRLGIGLERDGGGNWQLTALPEAWKTADDQTVRDLLDLRKAGADLADHWYATMACRKAAKDGDYLDATTAAALAEAALNLPIPRCPHGRPLWMEITLDQLLRTVRRIE